MGDPLEMDTIIGPLINRAAFDLVSKRVEGAVKDGARLIAGGRSEGLVYAATLLADVPESSDLARHETFGPVAALEVVADEDAGIARANATSYGLSAGIITTNTDKGMALADRIEAGIVHINEQTIGDEPQMPFGGVKDSGWGRFGGAAALDEFSELKWVTVQSGSHPYPF
jgi:aldehyde dehydrogenase (NAD+)